MKEFLKTVLTQKNLLWLLPHVFCALIVSGIVQALKEIFNNKEKRKHIWKGLVFLGSFPAAWLMISLLKYKFTVEVFVALGFSYAVVSSWLYAHGGKWLFGLIADRFKKKDVK